MAAFDLESSWQRLRLRLADGGDRKPHGRRRSDRGRLRLEAPIVAELRRLVLGQERPRMGGISRQLGEWCRDRGYRPPARATLYRALELLPGHSYRVRDLPESVRAALYNLEGRSTVPGHQLAQYCFNYGGLDAMSFAAGLPWLDLHQAAHHRGWRLRSRGLLDAVLRVRGIVALRGPATRAGYARRRQGIA